MNRQLALRGYIVALTTVSLAIVAASAWNVGHSPPASVRVLAEFALLVPLNGYLSTQRAYFTDSRTVLLGTIAQIAIIILLPIPLAIMSACAAKTISLLAIRIRRSTSTRKMLVNLDCSIITVALTATCFTFLSGPNSLWSADTLIPILAFPALIGLTVTYLFCDTFFITVAITLSTSDRLLPVVVKLFRETVLPDLSLVTVGIVFAALLHFSPLLSVFVAVPVYLNSRSFAAVARLRDQTEKSVMQLAKSVDMRDTGTGVHSQQLEQAATRLAAALGLIPEHVHEIGLAARAHDLGKIEISDAILLKRGPLTAEERAIMQEHANIGAEMLASYSAFERSLAFVRHHHERWDGKGYPDGLKGEEIPLGARIITVVDSYDAMVSDRPYRQSLGAQEAVSRLKDGMGTQFDPKVCAAWIQILIEDGTYLPSQPARQLQIVQSEAAG